MMNHLAPSLATCLLAPCCLSPSLGGSSCYSSCLRADALTIPLSGMPLPKVFTCKSLTSFIYQFNYQSSEGAS